MWERSSSKCWAVTTMAGKASAASVAVASVAAASVAGAPLPASPGATAASVPATAAALTRSNATQDAAGVDEILNIEDSFETADWTHPAAAVRLPGQRHSQLTKGGPRLRGAGAAAVAAPIGPSTARSL